MTDKILPQTLNKLDEVTVKDMSDNPLSLNTALQLVMGWDFGREMSDCANMTENPMDERASYVRPEINQIKLAELVKKSTEISEVLERKNVEKPILENEMVMVLNGITACSNDSPKGKWIKDIVKESKKTLGFSGRKECIIDGNAIIYDQRCM